jgi:hypothetical protein
MCFRATSVSVILEYEYDSREKGKLVGTLEFTGSIAWQFRNEMHSVGYSPESYDTLVEIVDSEWKAELHERESKYLQVLRAQDCHHYMVLLSDNGVVEVLAQGFRELRPREGTLA